MIQEMLRDFIKFTVLTALIMVETDRYSMQMGEYYKLTLSTHLYFYSRGTMNF